MTSLSDRIKAHAAKRKALTVKASDFLGDGVDGEFVVRSLSVAEDSEAYRAAVEFRKDTISKLHEKFVREFLTDPSFLEDAMSVEKLWRACRDSEDPSKPAFPSAQWMRETFTHDELTMLYGFYARALLIAGPGNVVLDNDQVDAMAQTIAFNASNENVDAVLMVLSKPVLVDAFVRLSVLHENSKPKSAA